MAKLGCQHGLEGEIVPLGALSFSLREASNGAGNVCERSQISRSLLILTYQTMTNMSIDQADGTKAKTMSLGHVVYCRETWQTHVFE